MAAAAPRALRASVDTCAACESSTPPLQACGRCRAVVYCCKEHQTEHWKRKAGGHRDACVVFAADAAAHAQPLSALALLHAALCRLLYKPVHCIKSMQAMFHVMDGRLGNFTVSDLQAAPGYARLSGLMRQHGMTGRGTGSDTPLESCKLAATLVLILCGDYSQGTKHLQDSAAWLSRSAGPRCAFHNADSWPSNRRDHVVTAAVSKAMQQCEAWAAGGSQGGSLGNAVCVAVCLGDQHVFSVPWRGGFAHSFVLVLAPTAAGAGSDDQVAGRLYMAFGPPDVGYTIRREVYTGAGSKVMGKAGIVQWLEQYEAMENCRTWGEAALLYKELFAAAPDGLEASYPFVACTKTRSSTFTRDSVEAVSKALAVMLQQPHAAMPRAAADRLAQ